MKQKIFVVKDVPKETVILLRKEGYAIVQGKDIKKEGKGASGLLCFLTSKVDK